MGKLSDTARETLPEFWKFLPERKLVPCKQVSRCISEDHRSLPGGYRRRSGVHFYLAWSLCDQTLELVPFAICQFQILTPQAMTVLCF
jgi:hypothetical protein